MPNKFKGFSKKGLKFFADLRNNNNKTWFDENRYVYDDEMLNPAKEFVREFGIMINPTFNAVPKVNQSLFRIHRDIRFSKNKTPYKEHFSMLFWEGTGKRMTHSGYYIRIVPEAITLYMGMCEYTKEQLERYRNAVMDYEMLAELEDILEEMKDKGYNIGGKHYKRIPNGFDKEYSGAEYLLYSSLWAEKTMVIPKEIYSEEFINFNLEYFNDMLPIHNWLMEALF